jgi:hypothetical protein
MRVVFVALGQEQLGISILSAVLRSAGHETALAYNPALFHDRYYFDIPGLGELLDRSAQIVEEILALKPDLLAFSVLTPTYTWSLEIAEAVKARTRVPVIFGGVHPSAVPEVCLENACVDYVCVGEGEAALLDLCDELDEGALRPLQPIANLWWRDEEGSIVRGPTSPFKQDLDALPFWDKELWEDDIRIGDNYLTMTSRGCPYRCTFCFNNFFAKLPGKGGGKYVRQRSVEGSMRELLWAKARYGIERVEFTDDIFTVDKEWIRAFLERYKAEIGAPFQCLVHPRFIDAEVARWLKEAGCEHVQMGVQSADEEYKRRALLRVEKDAHLVRALEAIAGAGLGMKLDHILGFPGEPRSAQEAARELYARFGPKRVNTFWLTYLPGIDMTRQALEAGQITADQVDQINRGKTRLFRHIGEWTAGSDLDFYQRYDVLFRMMPALPRALRERLRAEHIPSMSPRAASAVGFVFDVLNVLARRDGEALNYARHYAHQLGRQLPELMLGERAPARPRRVLPPLGPRRRAKRAPRRLSVIAPAQA